MHTETLPLDMIELSGMVRREVTLSEEMDRINRVGTEQMHWPWVIAHLAYS